MFDFSLQQLAHYFLGMDMYSTANNPDLNLLFCCNNTDMYFQTAVKLHSQAG